MVNVRLHPSAADAGSSRAPSRLNLLLSYSGWQPESWADRLPTLLAPMGVRAHRAGSGREASAVIASTPIHIAVVDLGLPLDPGVATAEATEPAGPRLLDLLRRLDHRPPTVAVRSAGSHRDVTRDLQAALRLGAFAVIDRPHSTRDLELLLEILRRALDRHYRGCWPGSARGSDARPGAPSDPPQVDSPR